MTAPLRIGSRRSPLARVQAEWVAERVEGCTAMVWVSSQGDRDRVTALSAFGGVGVFTAELNLALLDDRVDVAVHSLKDLPAGEIPGITLACVPVRQDPRDALVARDGLTLEALPAGARVGTGSPRRAAQLRRARPDLRIEPLRGNVDTRIAHVTEGRLDAIVLAAAGLARLERDVVTELLDPEVCLPAAGQGALGIVARDGDADAAESLARLRDVGVSACVAAERSALRTLGAGCHAPVGALAQIVDGRVRLTTRVLSTDGETAVERSGEGGLAEASDVGRRVAEALIEAGAGPLLETS